MTELAFWAPSAWEMAIIGIIALLLFGRRLPEVGRSLGKGIVEFKKGLKEVQDEVTKPADEEALKAETAPRPTPWPTSWPN